MIREQGKKNPGSMKTREWWVSGIKGERGRTNIVGGANPGQPTNPHGWIWRPSSSSTDECEHHEVMNVKSYLTLAIAKTLTCAWLGQDILMSQTLRYHCPYVYLTIVLRTVVEMS
ncbi:hypothetical protein NC653_006670 [Populus alba x Populus x berolinensis]|uniref:Uncharacterized protein n=1 Tax=Populus alba x Populus x berolinensis TaxID=444605 RepID=A0AAD6RES8_9ROSI|nr:hypothetical protein NC653_006670 [Populus alba x Populus x berolinensis]